MINVQALRLETGKDSEVSKIGINKPMKIGLFSAQSGVESTASIYLDSQQINQASSTIKLIVEHKPSYVMIDPNFTRTDRNLTNKITKIREH